MRWAVEDGVVTCLESDLNRHYAVFETALSTVGVPRPVERIRILAISRSDATDGISHTMDSHRVG